MIDDLPPLPNVLQPDPAIRESLPRPLAADGSYLRWKPRAFKQQLHRGNPAFLEDEMCWIIGIEPFERAQTLVANWLMRGLLSDEAGELVLVLLEMRSMAAGRAAGGQ